MTLVISSVAVDACHI